MMEKVRLRAISGTGLPKPGGFGSMFDKKADPYVVFQLNGETKQAATAHDVDSKFFNWPNDIIEFEIQNDSLPKELVVHVKDEDTGSDRYIGGAVIDFSILYQQKGSETTRTFPLEFSNEKHSKKKNCGEILLGFYIVPPVVENRAEPAIETPEPPPVEFEYVKGSILHVFAVGAENLAKKSGFGSLFDKKPDPYVVFEVGNETKQSYAASDVEVKKFEWEKDVQTFQLGDSCPEKLLIHVKDQDNGKDRYIGGTCIDFAQLMSQGPRHTLQLDFEDEKLSQRANCGSITIEYSIEIPNTSSELTIPVLELKPNSVLRVHPIYAKKLRKRQGIGAVLDSKADPYVVFQMGSFIRKCTPAKDVDSNHVVFPEDTQVFELHQDSPHDLLIHVKDHDMGSDRYIGGASIPWAKLFQVTDSLTVPLCFADETHSKMDNCGEISMGISIVQDQKPPAVAIKAPDKLPAKSLLRLHPKEATLEDLGAVGNAFVEFQLDGKAKRCQSAVITDPKHIIWDPDDQEYFIQPSSILKVHVKSEHKGEEIYLGGVSLVLSELLDTLDDEITRTVSLEYSDEALTVKKYCGEITLGCLVSTKEKPVAPVFPALLQVQAVSGRGLPQPKGLTSVFDKKADLYVEFEINGEIKRCATHENTKGSTVTWPNAVQDFDLTQSLPSKLIVHVKDDDAGSDRYVGGTSIDVTALNLSQSVPNCSFYPLIFSDPDHLKQKNCGEIELSITLLPAQEIAIPQGKTGNFSGTLDLKIIEAAHLPVPKVGLLSFDKKPDPYVVVSFPETDLSYKGPVCSNGGENPHWAGAHHRFKMIHPLPRRMVVKVYEHNAISHDTFLAAGWIDLSTVYTGKTNGVETYDLERDEELNVVARDQAASINLDLTFLEGHEDEASTEELMKKETPGRVGQLCVCICSIPTGNKALTEQSDLFFDVSLQPNRLTQQEIETLHTHVVQNAVGNTSSSIIEWNSTLQFPFAYMPDSVKHAAPSVELVLKDKNAFRDSVIGRGQIDLCQVGLFANQDQLTTQVMLLSAKSRRELFQVQVSLTFIETPTTRNPADLFATRAGQLHLFLLKASFLDVRSRDECKAIVTSPGKLFGEHRQKIPAQILNQTEVQWLTHVNIEYSTKHQKKECFQVKIGLEDSNGRSLGSNSINVLDTLREFKCSPFPCKLILEGKTIAELLLGLNFMTRDEVAAQHVETVAPVIEQPILGTGHLHIVVMQAKDLTQFDTANIQDCDPEVRVEIVPKYFKGKKVRSKMKTRPLENTGSDPVWNEYMKLDYCTPTDIDTLIAPMVKVSVWDIAMPGDSKQAKFVGAGEIPLAIFSKDLEPSHISPMTKFITLYTDEQTPRVSGSVKVCGIYEPIAAAEDELVKLKQTVKDLRHACSNSSEGFNIDEELKTIPGRIELHIKDMVSKELDASGFVAHAWLALSTARRFQSPAKSNAERQNPLWDHKFTLYTGDIEADTLRIDITRQGNLFSTCNLPLSSYGKTPGKIIESQLQLFDENQKLKGTGQCKLNIGIAFCPDNRVIHSATELYPKEGDTGTLFVKVHKATSSEDLDTPIALRLTTMFPKKGSVASQSEITSFIDSPATWDQAFSFPCHQGLSHDALGVGQCAVLRLELLSGTSDIDSAVLATQDIDLQVFINFPEKIAEKKITFQNVADVQLLLTFGSSDTDGLLNYPVPPKRRIQMKAGKLMIRATEGRNLMDVDENEEQDPFVRIKVNPQGGVAETNVALNEGCHPLWNSPVFELDVPDATVNTLDVEVYDSGADDGEPDQLIGDLKLSLYTLTRIAKSDGQWVEDWYPIFERGTSRSSCGEIRLEYRFTTEELLMKAEVTETQNVRTGGASGTLYINAIRAVGLKVAPGMKPALRSIFKPTNYTEKTKPGQLGSSCPEWSEQMQVEIDWHPESTEPPILRVEIVDMSMGDSQGAPVISYRLFDLAPFIVHPAQICRSWFPFGKKDEGYLLLSFQFIMKDSPAQVFDPQEEKKIIDPQLSCGPGQLHLKVVAGMELLDMSTEPSVKVEFIPGIAWDPTVGNLPSLFNSNRVSSCCKVTNPFVSSDGVYTTPKWDSNMLFDVTGAETLSDVSQGISSMVRIQLLGNNSVCGSIELPVFPFIQTDGHICCAWYPLSHRGNKVGQVKLEMQFLPQQNQMGTMKSTANANDYHLEILDGRQLRSMQRGEQKQDPFVILKYQDQTLQTKPHIDGGMAPVWNQQFILPDNLTDSIEFVVQNADPEKLGSGCIGTAVWKLPPDLVASGNLQQVLLTLESDAASTGAIRFRIKRGPFRSVGEAEPEVSDNRVGVLYVTLKKLHSKTHHGEMTGKQISLIVDTNPETCLVDIASDAVEKGVKIPHQSIGVIPIPGGGTRTTRNVPKAHCRLIGSLVNTADENGVAKRTISNSYFVLEEEAFHKILCLPNHEFSDVLPIVASDKEIGSAEIDLRFVQLVQGKFYILPLSVSLEGDLVQPGGSYCVEMRFPRQGEWKKSSNAVAGVGSTIDWVENSSPCQLRYSNQEETNETRLRLVVCQIQSGKKALIKHCYTSLSVLDTLAQPDQPMTHEVRIINVQTGRECGSIKLSIEFKPSEKQILDGTSEDEAIRLAEGTATLKKVFLDLGGSEDTPMLIQELEKAALMNEAAKFVLEKASGGSSISELFTAMDKNGDGMISWDEYLSYMQKFYLLADKECERINTAVDTDEESESGDESESGGVVDKEVADLDNESDPEVEAIETPRAKYQIPVPLPSPEGNQDDSEVVESLVQHKPEPPKQSRRRPEPKPIAVVKPRRQIVPELQIPMRTVTRPKGPLESRVLQWKTADVKRWLEIEMELPQYVEAFESSSVNGPLLLALSERELEQDLNISIPLHRRKILLETEGMQAKYGKAIRRPSRSQTAVLTKSKSKELPKVKRAPKVKKKVHRPPDVPKKTEPVVKAMQPKRPEKPKPPKIKKLEESSNWKFEYTGQSTSDRDNMRSVFKKSLRRAADNVERENLPTSEEIESKAYAEAMSYILSEVRSDTQVFDQPQQLSYVQVPSIANTDELLEIVKQAIWKYGETLHKEKKQEKVREIFESTDFGDIRAELPSDETQQEAIDYRTKVIRNVYDAFVNLQNNDAPWLGANMKLSRLKFEGGLIQLLSLDLSWDQFDMLFRRINTSNSGELSFDDMLTAFGDRTPGSTLMTDLVAVKTSLVSVVETLEAHDVTLCEAWQAFDRDNSGTISVAEFSTLIRYLTRKDRDGGGLSKHQTYLMMSCLDHSFDRMIQQNEFLRFFFIVWANQLMLVQNRLHDLLNRPDMEKLLGSIDELKSRKAHLRRALRKNFSRPFRDSMRNMETTLPGPFIGLLAQLNLSPQDQGLSMSSSTQVWHVLKDQTPPDSQVAQSSSGFTFQAPPVAPDLDETMRVPSVQAGGHNQLLRTKIMRDRKPERSHFRLGVANTVDVDNVKLKYDQSSA